MGSRAIITPHHPTTVQLTRVAGGGRFYAVCSPLLFLVVAEGLRISLDMERGFTGIQIGGENSKNILLY